MYLLTKYNDYICANYSLISRLIKIEIEISDARRGTELGDEYLASLDVSVLNFLSLYIQGQPS